jgi:hypothetical protein
MALLCDFQIQANRILRKKIAEDQFLDLVSVETEVRSVYKELYRWGMHLIKLKLLVAWDYLDKEGYF